jgi:MFS family permease
MTAEEIIRRNRRTCLTFNVLMSMFLGNSVMTTYYLAHGLSQTQIFILQSTLCVVGIGVDIPCGYIADRIGLRKVMVAGTLVQIVQGICFMFCQTFWQFMAALVLTGLHMGILKNTTDGVMMLSLKMLKDDTLEEIQYESYLIRGTRYSNIGYAASTLAGGGLVWLGGIAIPYYCQPVIYVGTVVCAYRIVNPVVSARPQHADKNLVIKVVRMMLVDRPGIRYMIGLTSSLRLLMMLCFWVLQPRMQLAGIPTWAYSIVYALWSGIVSLSANAGRSADSRRVNQIWMLLVVVPPVGVAVAGFTSGMLGFAALMVGLTFISVFHQRLFRSFLQRALPDDGVMRNTELAVTSTIPLLVYAIIAPFFGMLVDNTSVGVALVTVAIACFSFSGTSYFLFRRTEKY